MGLRADHDRVFLRMCEDRESAERPRQRLLSLGVQEYRRGPTTWGGAGYGRDVKLRRSRAAARRSHRGST
jgi:hypothetical protein